MSSQSNDGTGIEDYLSCGLAAREFNMTTPNSAAEVE